MRRETNDFSLPQSTEGQLIGTIPRYEQHMLSAQCGPTHYNLGSINIHYASLNCIKWAVNSFIMIE